MEDNRRFFLLFTYEDQEEAWYVEAQSTREAVAAALEEIDVKYEELYGAKKLNWFVTVYEIPSLPDEIRPRAGVAEIYEVPVQLATFARDL